MTPSEPHANPLRDPRDRRLPRIAGPCGMVLFGVTGDLSRKKIMPAIYDLANRGLLPPGFSLVGFARRDWADQDFAQIVHDSVREHARTEFREEVWSQLSEGFRFVPGDFNDDHAFELLRRTIEELEDVRGTGGNNAFYLAIEGGRHRLGATVQGVGAANRAQIERVFYRAFTAFLTPNASFAQARAATIQAARELYGTTPAVEAAVTQAWDAVGVTN